MIAPFENFDTLWARTSLTNDFVKLRQGSGKERQGKARMAKGERP